MDWNPLVSSRGSAAAACIPTPQFLDEETAANNVTDSGHEFDAILWRYGSVLFTGCR